MPYFIDDLCCGTVLIRKVNYTEMFQLTYVKKFFVHIALSCLLNYIFPVTYIQQLYLVFNQIYLHYIIFASTGLSFKLNLFFEFFQPILSLHCGAEPLLTADWSLSNSLLVRKLKPSQNKKGQKIFQLHHFLNTFSQLPAVKSI